MGESETEESKTRVSEERARKGTPFQSVSCGVMIIVQKKEKKKTRLTRLSIADRNYAEYRDTHCHLSRNRKVLTSTSTFQILQHHWDSL